MFKFTFKVVCYLKSLYITLKRPASSNNNGGELFTTLHIPLSSQLVHGLVHGMVDYAVFFPSLSTLTWDTFLTLRGTWGFYLNHVLPPRPSKSYRWGGGGGGGP